VESPASEGAPRREAPSFAFVPVRGGLTAYGLFRAFIFGAVNAA
jgi:hypothetical protein